MKEQLSLQEVALRLGLPCNGGEVYVDCPRCALERGRGGRIKGKRKLNINYRKNVFNCSRCGGPGEPTSGGPTQAIKLYMLFRGIDDFGEAYREFRGQSTARKKEKKAAPAPLPIAEEEKPAPIAIRDATYRALLSLCNLHERHRENLMARGLSKEQIAKMGYKSFPSNPKEVCKELLRMGCVLEKVPGFYKESDGSWTMNSSFARKQVSGILIPLRNTKGQIQGFQIRMDDSDDPEVPRYIHFTSKGREGGAAAKTYVHFRKGARGINEIVFTEGALKADIICVLSGYSVLAVPGVKCQEYVPRALRTLLKKGVKKITICYDMDLETNDQVRKAKDKLEATLNHTCSGCGLVVPERYRTSLIERSCPNCSKRLGISHSTRRWDLDENGCWAGNIKGLDDWLLHVRNERRKSPHD